MLSTYLSYNLLDRDMGRSLGRVAADPVVARDALYYRENIGAVSSVDEFLDDYRLYSYAMKAYGLEEMTYAVAFMRKVLESDLGDQDSFANKLQDERYREFAAAFAFGPNKASVPLIDIQSDLQEEATIGLYSRQIQDSGASYAQEYRYYRERITQIADVDAFLADRRLREFAFAAGGFDTTYMSVSHMRSVLTSDTSDPASYANQMADSDYAAFADLFNFQPDGSLPSGVPAQDASSVDMLTENYIMTVPDRIVPLAAELNVSYFEGKIASVDSVDALVADFRLVSFIAAAFGLPVSVSMRDDVRAALTSDLSDPNSFARSHANGAYLAMAELFSFATDGTLTGPSAQTGEQTEALSALYMDNYDLPNDRSDASESSYFRSATQLVFSVDALLKNERLYAYALTAFGLDPDTESREKIRRVLTSDSSDPRSYANMLADERYAGLAAAFNFDADGDATTARRAQSLGEINRLAEAYAGQIERLGIDRDQAEAEITYYREAVGLVRSVDDFLADDRLVRFVLAAKELDAEKVDADFLRDVLTSDAYDPDSFVNQQPERVFRELAVAFNFEADGSIAREKAGQGQSESAILRTNERYLLQTMEEDAGAENEGVRLALYFKRMASQIRNPFDILADPALQEVMRVALGLPPEIASADIDSQAAMIKERIDLAELSDPQVLERFIARFAALYDAENSAVTSSAATILAGQAAALGADMLMSLAQIKGRGF